MPPDTETPTATCAWHCSTCQRCHANACPALWGGLFVAAPCALRVRADQLDPKEA